MTIKNHSSHFRILFVVLLCMSRNGWAIFESAQNNHRLEILQIYKFVCLQVLLLLFSWS